jgi:hypothetical protein
MLSKQTKKYLKEVFGYTKVKDIELEDFEGEYFLDREIVEEYQKLQK